MPLTEFVAGQMWLQEYPIHFAGCDFNARMTVIRISDTQLMIHNINWVGRTRWLHVSRYKKSFTGTSKRSFCPMET